MTILEIALFLSIAAHLLVFMMKPDSLHLNAKNLTFVVGTVLVIQLLVDGYRWQLIPVYVVYVVLALLSLKRSPPRLLWRIVSSVVALLILVPTLFVVIQMPLVTWPEPAGPYAVGTFDLSVVDESRQERFDPKRKRKLYLQMWYPTEQSIADPYPKRSLYRDLHSGDGEGGLFQIVFSYLHNVTTHSHNESPIAQGKRFPVLIFNPGFMVWTDSNTLLMEHLASNGYVIVGIGHPYETSINLAGFPLLARQVPGDVTLGEDPSPDFLYFAGGGDLVDRSPIPSERKQIFVAVSEVLEQFSAAPDIAARRKIVKEALRNPDELGFLETNVSEDVLNNFLMTRMHMNLSTQTWVEDTAFVVDNITNIEVPIDGFSSAFSIEKLGVFGVSFGGSTAGEFCKIDSRCDAGSNLDGMQWGAHWRTALKVPFLRWSNDGIRGENDFSYLPHDEDFLDYQVRDSLHGDFLDIPYVFPHSSMLGIKGEIDGLRMIEIINGVQLEFFDQHLKGKPKTGNLLNLYPEIIGSHSGQ